VVFIAWQLKMGSKAMTPFEFLTGRTVVSANLTSFLVFGSVFIVVYYIPERFQAIKGASPIESGIRNSALFVRQILGSVIPGTMINKLGCTNPWTVVETVFAAVATGLYSTFEVNIGYAAWIGYQALNGLGAGA
jgi:predicted MFS family arabinose efflux permease